MLKIIFAAAVSLAAASAAHAACTLVGGPLNGAVLTVPTAPSGGVIGGGTFTSPPGIHSATVRAGGFTLGNGTVWEVATIDSDKVNYTDFDVVIILKAALTTYEAWGEESPAPPFHRMNPTNGTVTGATGGHC